ncbi:alpha-ketoglutarate-dependent dioxygenase AlkB [Chitinophaga sp. Cy-1792]|uniref:alpha-ketoglutarate-dependent dioxygenase AlkB family protein n=1 Tax=Chitinophaga sp. Cy-1792 TaxID=2608339 RepID=UPI0014227570|nr:alpha-ketoglutarate-dependent dioxygenase AlkB [Chitinophaga sp. Cy-1792]NIG52308.1 alpha-ketoglutarate-dependent dioxygenase AlkB [Chitinophaga sp. Cy-1792]
MSLQGSLFEAENTGKEIILIADELIYYPQFFSIADSNRYWQILLDTINWKQASMMMYGREVLFPRLMAWYGDAATSYGFSGNTFTPNPWTDTLLEIKERIRQVSESPFNSVLLNYYRNGNDSMGWHADDEPELGQNPVIASINFGATRRFLLRQTKNHSVKHEIAMQHGSLLLMKGTLQHHWEHQVPKTAKPVEGRINLTFRYIYT